MQLENVCEEMKGSLCSYIEKCDLEWYLQFATRGTCDELFDCEDMELDEMAKSVDAGRMAYDAGLAGDCLHAIRSAACADIAGVFENMPDECENVFSGLVAKDGDCYREAECAAGLYCDQSVSDCPGQCLPYKSLGDSCSGGDCDPDVADCDFQQGVCAELAGSGEICDYVGCRESLVCDSDNDPAVCIAPASAGSACSSTRGCDAGLQCVGGKCAGPAGAGQACDIGADFSNILFACRPGYYCDADIVHQQSAGTCLAKKGSGSECILFYECTANLLCIGMQLNQQTHEVTPGSCGKPLGVGAPCTAGFEFPECDWDLYCDDQTAVCTAYPGIGDPCIYGQAPECFGADLYCDSSQAVCQNKKPDGSSCTDYYECLSDDCDVGGTDKCLPKQSCKAP